MEKATKVPGHTQKELHASNAEVLPLQLNTMKVWQYASTYI